MTPENPCLDSRARPRSWVVPSLEDSAVASTLPTKLFVAIGVVDDRERDGRGRAVTGVERIETVSQLGRAGYSTEEIIELVGEPVSEDTDTDQDGG